jgi:hypothetical protein
MIYVQVRSYLLVSFTFFQIVLVECDYMKSHLIQIIITYIKTHNTVVNQTFYSDNLNIFESVFYTQRE